MSDQLFSIGQVIGKTLFAKEPVVKKLRPSDADEGFATVIPGGFIGVVYSYILPKSGRNENIYWMFYDQNNTPYYVQHESGKFDLSALQQQGAKDVETVIKEEEAKAKEDAKGIFDKIGDGAGTLLSGVSEWVKDLVKYLIIILAIVFIAKLIIQKKASE